MTSGNLSDEPIAIDNEEARERLGGIADAFLDHDRPIHRRCEDSVVRAAFPLRRSRGYVPASLPLPAADRRTIVAAGAELKSTFCVAARRRRRSSRRISEISTPKLPTGRSSRISSCTSRCSTSTPDVDRARPPPGVPLDEVGDGAGRGARRRAASPRPRGRLPRGARRDRARRSRSSSTGPGSAPTARSGAASSSAATSTRSSGSRTSSRCLSPAATPRSASPGAWPPSQLELAGRPVPFERLGRRPPGPACERAADLGHGPAVRRRRRRCSALRERVTYEGQAAIELEQLAGEMRAAPYAWEFGAGTALVAAVHDDLARGRPRAEIAAAFHEAVAAGGRRRLRPLRRAAASSSSRAAASRTCASSRRRVRASSPRLPRPDAPAGAAERRRHQLRPGRRGSRFAVTRLGEQVDPDTGATRRKRRCLARRQCAGRALPRAG